MEFSVEKAKSIFDLIQSISPYAYPLLISLIFPLLWIAFKNLLGVRNQTNSPANNDGNLFERTMRRIWRAISLNGDVLDRIVFYSCIILFFIGGIVLKIGEHNEEIIRQKTLSLKHLYQENGFLYYSEDALKRQKFTESQIEKILYNYPNVFVRDASNTTRILCVDTSVKEAVKKLDFGLLDSYLAIELKDKSTVQLDSIFEAQDDKFNNVKKLFSQDIVYSFLSHPTYKSKYSIHVINNKDFIIKN